jgi:hypothetical protein
MTENELRRRFPNASPSFLKANSGHRVEGVCAKHSEPDERVSLDGSGEGKEACWHEPAERFEITFIIYAQRPADWDGWDIKALQDFCVKAGIITDDGWKTLSGRVYSRKVATQDEEKTVIEVTAL